MALILGLVVVLAFGWYWWQATAFGGFAMMWPMALGGLFLGAAFSDQGQPLSFVVMCIGIAIAWLPYWLANRRKRALAALTWAMLNPDLSSNPVTARSGQHSSMRSSAPPSIGR